MTASPPIPIPALEGPWLARFDRFSGPLEEIFSEMDRCYAAAADAFGFCCRGCSDNCCRSRFFHHTLLEVLYLARGFDALPQAEREAVRVRAREAVQNAADRPMCPFNWQERCRIYRFRPMICRLHGLPSQLAQPGKPAQVSPGCEAFMARHGEMPSPPLDRSPHYTALARLESEFRNAVGFRTRIHLTIAEIVCAWPAPGGPEDPGRGKGGGAA
jgi:Fe-S-cluster containining protein